MPVGYEMADHPVGGPPYGGHGRDAQPLVHLGALLVVDAGDDPGHAEGLPGQPGGDDVGVVAAGYGGERVRPLDARGDQHLAVEPDAVDGEPGEIGAQPPERVGVLVDDRDRVSAGLQGMGERRADPSTTHDHDVHLCALPAAERIPHQPAMTVHAYADQPPSSRRSWSYGAHKRHRPQENRAPQLQDRRWGASPIDAGCAGPIDRAVRGRSTGRCGADLRGARRRCGVAAGGGKDRGGAAAARRRRGVAARGGKDRGGGGAPGGTGGAVVLLTVVASPTSLLKRLLIGRPVKSDRMQHTLLPKRIALPVFASDALSSVAYAPDEILLTLSVGGAAFFAYSPWIALAVAAVMVVVVASYRQNVHAYPSGGGDYEVATVNLGPRAGLVVASALMVDYVLTVAVSVSSGVENLGSAWGFAAQHKVEVAVVVVAILTAMNLRGIREAGKWVAVPGGVPPEDGTGAARQCRFRQLHAGLLPGDRDHHADPGAGRQHRLQRLPGARLDPRPGPVPAPPAAHPRRPAGVQQRHPLPRRLRGRVDRRVPGQGDRPDPALHRRRVRVVHAVPDRHAAALEPAAAYRAGSGRPEPDDPVPHDQRDRPGDDRVRADPGRA